MIDLTFKRARVLMPVNNKVIEGEFIFFEHNSKGWYVQNLHEQQNADVFCEGIKLIFKMDGKRGAFLQRFVTMMAKTFDEGGWFGKVSYSQFIAFVCDVALHKNPKLAHETCYHKDFKKYVANLCYNYYLDEDFEQFKVDEYSVVYPRYTGIDMNGLMSSINDLGCYGL